MKNSALIIILFGLIACDSNKNESNIAEDDQLLDNPKLIEIYANDQSDRKSNNIDWSVVSVNDNLREQRIYKLLDSNKVRTSLDYFNAAMVFQHGRDSIAYGMAVKMMRKSIKLDPSADKWLLAAAIDRDLLSRNKPQIYGTQS